MSELEAIIKDLDDKTRQEISDFVLVCADLTSLIERENTLLLNSGTVAFDGMFVRKINMLEKFEKQIRNVLNIAKEKAPENISLQDMLVEKIQEVRRTLSINTTFQLRDLRKRTKRMAKLKNTLLDFSSNNISQCENENENENVNENQNEGSRVCQ